MRNISICILVCIGVFHSIKSSSQASSVFNLNITNGLPTNSTYCLLIDTHGYLWIATTKGVVRYNGYESKLYNFSDGLLQEDTWRLYEDKKNRIWFLNISPFLGYVLDNKFHSAKNHSGATLYPIEIKDYDQGIFFLNRVNISGNVPLFYERNDTIYSKTIPYPFTGSLIVDSSAIVLTKTLKEYYSATPDFNDLSNIAVKKLNLIWNGNDSLVEVIRIAYGHYLLSYNRSGNYLRTIGLTTHVSNIIDFRKFTNSDETIIYIFRYDDGYYGHPKLCIVGNKSLYLLDSSLTIKERYPICSLINEGCDGNKISFFWQDKFWKNCISTKDRGVFINYENETHFEPLKEPDLSDFSYVGRVNDSTCFWWNNEKNILAKVIRNNKIILIKNTGVKYLNSILPYNDHSLLMIAANNILLFDQRTGKLSFFVDKGSLHTTERKFSKIDGYAGFLYGKNNYYIISKTNGLHQYCFEKGYASEVCINSERFNDITFDYLRKNIWVYNDYDLEIYKPGGSVLYSFPWSELKRLKIKNIEKVIIDSVYGNVFLKENNRLLHFDSGAFSYHTLFDDYVLDGSLISVYKEQLIVAGEFGVLFCRIQGPGKLSSPVLYRNIKNTNYSYVTGIQCSDDKVLMKTDKGEYLVKIPANAEFESRAPEATPYKLVLTYNDHLFDLVQSDTIVIFQNDMTLHFDVINPYGNGAPHYRYSINGIDSAWHEMNANEVLLHGLAPGSYHNLSLVIQDKVWRSRNLNFVVYVSPYWWQRPFWKRVFWASVILLIALFGGIVAYITRKIVQRANLKKNMRLELELKAIYSQLNPHFIYNTLNSVLFLISEGKMDEAYTHVAKFSKLLRAYVKSSRQKYISISGELANLKNYIELQQTRFGNKFDYEITNEGGMGLENIKIPSLLLQPFVENAIHHGLLHKNSKGMIRVNIKYGATTDEVLCVIEDDGVGRAHSKTLKENATIKTESYGDEIIRDLISVFNQYEKMRLEINYVDKTSPETGTIVEIRIKNLQYES